MLGCPIPSDINPLSSNGFRFSVARIPQLTYFCQQAPLPGITLPNLDISTPFIHYPVPGDVLEYDVLNIRYIIDSTMSNYIALFNWIRGLGFPENNTQYVDQVKDGMGLLLGENASAMSDASLAILNNTNNVVQTVLFKDCVLVNLGGVTLNTTDSDVTYLEGDAMFKYSYYTFLN